MAKPIKHECTICEEETLIEVISGEVPCHCPMCGYPIIMEEEGYEELEDD
ncbi:hypothetical protein N9157_02570 [Saprospiraceae bacterium]|jgi:DNA-directed RNA polymerase subunit RPC12/RpoP|nr:hypothetical protein [Saprospiraceae bacterium]|tara:strand:+ start:13123 stop:13272 length:150 start_codon:yes stop_codon:yes gene_type:complete